jgi:hypothetical protein
VTDSRRPDDKLGAANRGERHATKEPAPILWMDKSPRVDIVAVLLLEVPEAPRSRIEATARLSDARGLTHGDGLEQYERHGVARHGRRPGSVQAPRLGVVPSEPS